MVSNISKLQYFLNIQTKCVYLSFTCRLGQLESPKMICDIGSYRHCGWFKTIRNLIHTLVEYFKVKSALIRTFGCIFASKNQCFPFVLWHKTTSMVMKDLEDEMCWWHLFDFREVLTVNVTWKIRVWHQYLKIGTNIEILSPT